MLLSRSEVTGEPKDNLFGGFQERPDYVNGNPLLARFLAFLNAAVRNIRNNRIPRLLNTRQDGMLRIGQEKFTDIPGRVDPDTDLGEMVQDILSLLRRKEQRYGIPLAALFQAIMEGMTVNDQRREFGDWATRRGRGIIRQAIEEYARLSGNYYLGNLVRKLTDPRERPVEQKLPVLSDQERDYRSIASVVARFDRPVGSADLGRFRRRWLEFPPRTKNSTHRNRLEDVLAQMVSDGVLNAKRGIAGGQTYSPGPQFSRYSA